MTTLSACAAIVRVHDPDRFLTALFAPSDRREALFTLYAFNHELARAREAVSQPMLALIRLQWWREVVQGARRRHEVAGPVGEALDAGSLDADDLEAMVAGREAEADTIATLDDWRAYLLATAGAVQATAGRVLGAGAAERERMRRWGAVYGGAGVLRSVPVVAQQGRCLLPEDVLSRHGLTVAATPDEMRGVVDELMSVVRAFDGHGALARERIAAALPVVLARRDLARLHAPVRARGLGDRLAVTTSALTRKI